MQRSQRLALLGGLSVLNRTPFAYPNRPVNAPTSQCTCKEPVLVFCRSLLFTPASATENSMTGFAGDLRSSPVQ
ncbi:hypothetical protein VTN96DRAFT_8700 [Rasamsonia emersonii]